MPDDCWALIYAEQVSFFLETIWLRVIELYERRCGAVPEALHWHSHSQWVKQYRQERVHLAMREAILVGLLHFGIDESVLASSTTFKAGKADYLAALDTPAAPAIAEPSQPGSLAPDKGGTHLGYTLDTAAPTVPDLADVWASLLCKNVVYTLADLDRLLVSLGLLTDAASRTPTADFKSSAVLGAVKALRERGYLRGNNAKLARLLAARYPDKANIHTIKRGTDSLTEPATPFYTRALALLPAP